MLNAQEMLLDASWRLVVWLYHGGGLRASMVPFWRRGGMLGGGWVKCGAILAHDPLATLA